jgi:archaellum component FlaC
VRLLLARRSNSPELAHVENTTGNVDVPLGRDLLLDKRHRDQRRKIFGADRLALTRMERRRRRRRQVSHDVVSLRRYLEFFEKDLVRSVFASRDPTAASYDFGWVMGLFRKKTNEPKPIEVLIAEIVVLKRRLDAADQHKTELHLMIDTVDKKNSVLNLRLDSLNVAGNEMQSQLGAVAGDVGAVRDGISVMQQRVGEFDAKVADVTQRVGAVDDQVSRVGQEVGEVGRRFGAITELSDQVRALADRLEVESKKVPALPRPDLRIEAIFARIDQLVGSVTEHDGRIDQLTGSITNHSGQINAAQAALNDADVARVESEQARAAELAALSEQLHAAAAAVPNEVDAASAADVQAVQDQVSQMAEKTTALDNRMNKVSLELANQLTELSNDLDGLLDQANAEKEPSADVHELVTEAIGSVQRSTDNLAAEQARYEIQFRADLAELAELVRRPLNSNQRSPKQ